MPCPAAPPPRPPFGQIIIAGSGDDIVPADMLSWIAPVLSGIRGGRWLTCEIARSGKGTLSARLCSGAIAPHLALCHAIPRHAASPVMRLMPDKAPIALVLLDEHAAQVMSLLDGMAQWLNLFEADDPALRPVMALLARCQGQTEKGPRVAGALS